MKFHILPVCVTFALISFASVTTAQTATGGALDTIVFGDATSERAHNFEGAGTKTVTGALGQPARVSLPKVPVDYYGGDLSFDLKVDPIRQNYFTVKFWGSDLNGGQKALLYINGEQLGYRHMGDYEALNHGAEETSFKDRFFYYTDILPLLVTHGRKQVTLTLKTIGPIAGYQLGGGYDGYQKKMEAPSRSYYRAYTHLNPAEWGQENEKQGIAPPPPPIRPMQDEVKYIAAAKDADARAFNEKLNDKGNMSPGDIAWFAQLATRVWPDQNEAVRQQAITQFVRQTDAMSANAYNPDFFAHGVYQGDWGGSLQAIGEAVYWMNKVLTAQQWQILLDTQITVKGEAQTRRAAWTRMLKGNFDYARTHVARISNQADICLYGAYKSNKGLQIINPAVAEPEESAKRFLFEAAGIMPYRGNDILDANGKLIGREDPFGQHYMEVTDKGLTREFTYVAIYGEWTNDIGKWWEMYGHDELLKKALINSDARAHMREPDFDEDGFRAMRMEGVIESRGPAYPDNLGYGVRWNGGHGMDVARLTRLMEQHPEKYRGPEWAPYWKLAQDAVGYAQQFVNDNQYLPSISEGTDLTDYLYVKHHAPVGVLLPTSYLKWYSPQEMAALKAAGLKESNYQRFAWTDEDDGIVVLRDGDLLMFLSLIQKGNWGINGVSRVHCITPTYDRLATVVPDVQFAWNGQYSVRPNWTNVQFMDANNAPEAPYQVMAGEVLPLATQPNVQMPRLVDTPYAGYANFYALRYGPYLIGQNTTRAAYGNARSYELKLPKEFKGKTAYDFVSGKTLPIANGALLVGPQSTVVVKLDAVADARPPMAPRLVLASRDNAGVTVRWIPAGGAIRYSVKRGTSNNGQFVQVGETNGDNSFVDKGGVDSAFYTVTGSNENGAGLDSPVAKVAPLTPEALAWLNKAPADVHAPPGAVRDVRGENIKRAVNLWWKVAPNAWSYEVSRSTDATGPFAPVATTLKATRFAQDGLSFGQRYFYRVAALNRDGSRGPQSAAVSFAPMDDTIPAPWKGTDIGDVGAAGSDGLLGGVFTIHGSGEDVWAAQDEFHYVYQTLEGDGSIITRVTNQQNTSEWTKSGLMFRASLDPSAQNAFVFVTPGHGVVYQARGDNGGGTGSPGQADGGVPRWLKLTRVGNTFTAVTSADGKDWTTVGTTNIAMPKTALIGLAVNAHSKGAMNLSQFDNVALSGAVH